MKRSLCFILFSLMIFHTNLGFCEAKESSLKMLISKVPNNDKNTIIEVKIINVSNDYVSFLDTFFFQDNSILRVLPLSELRFYIDRGKGFERLPYPEETYFPQFIPPNPKYFFILAPTYIWGIQLNMESIFTINFPKGNYMIKAEFENRSRSWMYKYYKKEEIQKMHVDEQNIFDGVIESNPLNIEIGK